jgi:ATP-dependent DNA helicase RecQ
MDLLKALRKTRSGLATLANLPSYCICSNKTLVLLATCKPKTREEFLDINGIGDIWYDKYAQYFDEVINGKKEINNN